MKAVADTMSSIKYMHVPRLYSQAADHLASDALSKKAGRVVSSLSEQESLARLNRLHEIVYKPKIEPIDAVISSAFEAIPSEMEVVQNDSTD